MKAAEIAKHATIFWLSCERIGDLVIDPAARSKLPASQCA